MWTSNLVFCILIFFIIFIHTFQMEDFNHIFFDINLPKTIYKIFFHHNFVYFKILIVLLYLYMSLFVMVISEIDYSIRKAFQTVRKLNYCWMNCQLISYCKLRHGECDKLVFLHAISELILEIHIYFHSIFFSHVQRITTKSKLLTC